MVMVVAFDAWAADQRAPSGVPLPAPNRLDAGAPLSARECDELLNAMMTLSIAEQVAADLAVVKMTAEEKAATVRLATKQGLADPKLAELKAACPKRYTAAQRDCILAAKSMSAVDACSK